MDRTAFTALAGLDAELPQALLLPQAIRRLHDADLRASDLRARVVTALRARSAGATEVPLPLDVGVWCREILDHCTPQTLAADLLATPRATFAYLGLANLDAPTRAFVAASPALLRFVARDRPGTLAAFGDAIRVREGRVLVPGGPEAEPLWTAVVGSGPDRPEAFIRSVLATGDGRLAYFYDTVSHLSPAQRRFALGTTPELARAMADRFAAIPGPWTAEALPFLRPPLDPASVLLRVGTDDRGRLTGPRAKAFWSLALDPDGPAPGPDRASVFDGPEIDAPWIVSQISGDDSRRRLARLQVLLFVQRRLQSADDVAPADAIEVARAVARMPALVLPLERAGVTDIALLSTLVRRARALTDIVSVADRRVVLAQWQSAIALVTRLRSNGVLDAFHARALLTSLAALEARGGRFDDRLAGWLRGDLLPSLSAAPEGVTAVEPILLDALAGVGAAGLRPPVIEWEGARYVLDRAAAERERLADVRSTQQSPTLDDAFEAFSVARALITNAGAPALRARVEAVRARLPARSEPGTGTAEVARVLSRVAELAAPDARAREHASLMLAAEHLLADALTSLVYACALGSSDNRVFLAGDVSTRHDFGSERAGMPPGPSPPWALPSEQAAAGHPWHVQGALIGLDVSLARLRLMRLLGTMPPHQSLVNAAERAALVLSVTLTPGTMDAQDAQAMVDAMARGRERVLRADDEERRALCAEAGLCGWRSEIVAWAREHERQAALATVTRAELAWAGRVGGQSFADGWGTASAVNGELAVRFPLPLPIETIAGRPTLAHGLTVLDDLRLRIGELLVQRRLPASLARDLAAVALQDYLDQVQPAYPDDWLAFALEADRLTAARADDYLSALTAPGGPLLPARGEGALR